MNERKRLVVKPTVPGYGVVMGECRTLDPSGDYEGCIVVDLLSWHERGYRWDTGSVIAYSTCGDGRGRTWYETCVPDTSGT